MNIQILKKIGSVLGSFVLMGTMVIAYQNCSSSSEFSSRLARNAAVQVKASDFNINGEAVNRAELEGTSVSFSTPAGAIPNPSVFCDEPVSFQYSKDGENIPGATSAVYTIPMVALNDAGAYFLEVQNCGETNRMGPINLSVVPMLYVQDSDLGNKSLPETSDTSFFANAAGPENISYQWYFRADNALIRQMLAGQNQPAIQLGNVSEADQGFYELEITSTQNGIDQTLSAGPAFLDVFQIGPPPSATALAITSNSPVIEGNRLEFTSEVTGGLVSSQAYQWFFNGAELTGETSPGLVIDPADLSDMGVYHLIVTEEGNAIQSNFSSVNVNCPTGLANVNGQCEDINPPALPITIGITGPNTAPEAGDIEFTSFLSGLDGSTYQWLFNGQPVTGATGTSLQLDDVQLSDAGGYQLRATTGDGVTHLSNVATLTVQCNGSQVLLNGVCQDVVPATVNLSGNSFVNEQGTINLTCSAFNFDNPVYEWTLNGEVLVGETSETLSVTNVTPQDMGLYSCTVSDDDDEVMVAGLNVVVNCLDGNVVNNGQCVPVSRTCQTDDGLATGFEILLQNGGYSSCIAQGCNTPATHILVNGTCVTKTGDCSDQIANGSGAFTRDASGSPSTCAVTSCDAGYVPSSANTCIKKFEACPIENGTGLLENTSNGPGECRVDNCNSGFVNVNGTNTCTPDTQACTVLGGRGTATVTSQGAGTCVAEECFTPYELNGGRCVLNTGPCSVANGTGNFGIDSQGVYKCIASSCNAPHELSDNACRLPNGICDSVPNGRGVLVGTNTNGSPICQATSCNEGYRVENGQCVLDLGACPIQNGQGFERLSNGRVICEAITCNTHFRVSNDERSCEFTGGSCNLANGTARLVNNGGRVTCEPTGCDPAYELISGVCRPRDTSCTPRPNAVGRLIFTSNSAPPRCDFVNCIKGFTPVGNQCVFRPVACNFANGITGKTSFNTATRRSECRPTACVTPGKVLTRGTNGRYSCIGSIPPPQPPAETEVRVRTIFRRGSIPSVPWTSMTSLTRAQINLLKDGVTNVPHTRGLTYTENNLGYFAWKFPAPRVVKTATMYPSNNRGHSARYEGGSRPDMTVYVSNNGVSWSKIKDTATGSKTGPIVMQFNAQGRAYRYLQIITNINSDRNTNYVTEINLSDDGLLCTPRSTTSCNGGGTRTCNADGSAYGRCVPKAVSKVWSTTRRTTIDCHSGRDLGGQCEDRSRPFPGATRGRDGVYRKPSFQGGGR